jgi:hypothetical protein
MKTTLLLFLTILITPFLSFSQSYYESTFNFGQFDHPEAMITDNASNVVVCGWSENADHTNQQAFALKVDANGQEIWRTVIETSSKYYNLCFLESGDIALAGSKGDHCYLTVINAETGNEVWSFEEDASDGFWFATVNELLTDNGYCLYAVKSFETEYNAVIYIFESLNGELRQQFIYPQSFLTPIEYSFQQSPEIFCYGMNQVVVQTNFDFTSGFIWTWASEHTPGMVRLSENEGCIVRTLGGSNYYSIGLMTYNFIGEGFNGNWIEMVYDEAEGLGVGMLGYEKILLTGTINGELALWLIGNDLNLLDELTYPNSNPRTGIAVTGLPSNEILMMGSESLENGDATDVFLMKRDANGELVSTPDILAHSDIQIFPNPATDRIFIKNIDNQNIEVDIMNSLGQIVKRIRNTNQYISIEDLPDGCYVAMIKTDGITSGQMKFIKQ